MGPPRSLESMLDSARPSERFPVTRKSNVTKSMDSLTELLGDRYVHYLDRMVGPGGGVEIEAYFGTKKEERCPMTVVVSFFIVENGLCCLEEIRNTINLSSPKDPMFLKAALSQLAIEVFKQDHWQSLILPAPDSRRYRLRIGLSAPLVGKARIFVTK